MKYQQLGSTDMNISKISFGTWAIGGSWGNVDESEAIKGLEYAMEAGVNFFDTADVYGDGRAEKLLGKTANRKDIYIASKFCRAGDIHDPATYSEESVRSYCEGSLSRLNRDAIDLYQIHCPPLDILKDGKVFEVLEKLKSEGKIRYYGVSVETVDEGLFCLEHTGASALQVIFNLFRQKPLEELLPAALKKNVGILARLPLASGLLTGKFTKDSSFDENDHRNFNKDGAAFNVGETFAGLPFEKGVELSKQLGWIAEDRGNMTRAALKWIIEHEAVTSAIPGFRNTRQVEDNLAALNVKEFSEEEKKRLAEFYNNEIEEYIRGAY